MVIFNLEEYSKLTDGVEAAIMERLSVEESIQGKELQVFEQRKYF